MGYLDDKQKAVVAFILTTVGSLATWAVTEYPDNEDVQTWGGLIIAVLTILATTYGVFKVRNGEEPTQLPAAPPYGDSSDSIPPASDPPLA